MIESTYQLVVRDKELESLQSMLAKTQDNLAVAPSRVIMAIIGRIYGGSYAVLNWEIDGILANTSGRLAMNGDQAARVYSVIKNLIDMIDKPDMDLLAKLKSTIRTVQSSETASTDVTTITRLPVYKMSKL